MEREKPISRGEPRAVCRGPIPSLFGAALLLGAWFAPALAGPDHGDQAAVGEPDERPQTDELADESGQAGDLLDEFELLEDEATVELPARHRQALGMSPSAITVITRQDIETSGATTIPDLLRLVPGMDVVVTSRFLTAITSRLYWTDENNHYLVLVDGREANLELMGQAPWEIQPISLDDIERIEVIRGPGSALYGANAMAGVVSIVSRSVPERTSAWVQVLGGEGGVFSTFARASARLGDLGISVSGGVDQAGRFLDSRVTTKDVWKARALVEYRLSDSRRLLLDAGMAEGTGAVSTAVGNISGNMRFLGLRLAYESDDLRGQLYWTWIPVEARLDTPLVYLGAQLASFVPATVDSHTFDGQLQYSLPRFWEPLLVIVGVDGRGSWLGSDELLDGETFADPDSSGYLQPGISHWEARTGAYLHAELAPADWITLTGGVRFDYNTVTDFSVSPRLAAVVSPWAGQYLRLGAARAFRKPAFVETFAHFDVVFPPASPIVNQNRFRRFMAGLIGNPDLGDEVLWSFELGYRGQFWDNRLQVALDLYYNLYSNQSLFHSVTVEDPLLGLPDLDRSSYRFESGGGDLDIFGSELSLRLALSRRFSLLFNWAYREVLEHDSRRATDTSPKHLIGLGGRYSSDLGLLGSLYVFTRSEFTDRTVENPAGVLGGYLVQHMDDAALVLARVGWRLHFDSGLQAEAGLNLMLPISPFRAPHFRYREKGGFELWTGRQVGGEELARAVSIYLQGTY